MTFWETIERGEYVMFALAVILIIIVVIWISRSLRLNKDSKRNGALMARVRDHVAEGDLDNARQLCDTYATPGSRMLAAGLKRVGHPMSEVKASMDEVAHFEKEGMNKGERWLRVMGVISPLLGLGGTLVGIIDRLRDLGESEVPVDINVVCEALAPTIVTTVAGLGVGIFALIALTALDATVSKVHQRLDSLKMTFTNLLNEPSPL